MTFISRIFHNAKDYIIKHKIISTIGFLIIIFGGYWVYGKVTSVTGDTRYMTATVGTDTLITTVTGTGQVSASNQVTVNPKASGDIVYVGVKAGQKINAGQTIAEIDPTSAQKAVRDAQISLQSAQLSLAKLQEPATALTTTQTQDALTQAQNNLQTAYVNGTNSVSNTFLDLPGIMTGLQNILYGTDVSHGSQDNISAYNDLIVQYIATSTVIRDQVVSAYSSARNLYTNNFSDYQGFNPSTAATSSVSSLVNETYGTTQSVSNTVKRISDYLNFIKDTLTLYNKNVPTALTTAQATLATYTSQLNSHKTDLSSIVNTITTSEQTIVEKSQSLTELQSGADPIDLQSSQLNVTQKENALQDAKDNLADYYISAPFSGTVSTISVQVGDAVGSGTSVATVITPQQVADISLNEVDVAKIKLGDKATLTFDAISGLSITGVVSQIDSVGTVNQGVVTYNVKITFDTQDSRILPGMSTSAAIITNVKPNVVVVSNSALKTQGTTHYVQVFNPPLAADTTGQGTVSTVAPTNQVVQIGLVNNTETEITSGLNVGDQIVTRTIAATTKTTTTATPSLLSGATGGGTFRAGGAAGR